MFSEGRDPETGENQAFKFFEKSFAACREKYSWMKESECERLAEAATICNYPSALNTFTFMTHVDWEIYKQAKRDGRLT